MGARAVIWGKNVVADGLEEELVTPGRYGDDVMQELRSAPDVVRLKWVGVKMGGHGFHAFAYSGQEEAEAVAGSGLMPVPVFCRLRQTLEVGGKTLFAWSWRGAEAAGPRRKCIKRYDTVILNRSYRALHSVS